MADQPAGRRPPVGQGQAAGREERCQGVEVEGDRAHLVVKVAAPPEGGKANAATIKLLAKYCGVAAGAPSLVSGAAGRRKVVDIRGEPDVLAQRLRALASGR